MAFGKTGRAGILSGAALAAALLLSGCAGKPLIEREIVRAVFFAHDGGKYQAVLLLQDQQSEETNAYRTADGEGRTAPQALADAAQGLGGTIFYGAMDTVAVPPDTGWEELWTLTELIGDSAQPSPEISLFMLDARSADRLIETAGELYDEMQQCGQRYGVHCGMEAVRAQSDVAALPCWQGSGYGFAVLPKGGRPLRYTEPLRAQLAAALCGQADRLDVLMADAGISCQAGLAVSFRATAQKLQITLRLSDAKLVALSQNQPDDQKALQQALQTALQEAFAQLTADAQQSGTDPFRFLFWSQCLWGPEARALPAELEVEFA